VRLEEHHQQHPAAADRAEKEPIQQGPPASEGSKTDLSAEKEEPDTPVGGEPNLREQKTLPRIGESLPYSVFLVAIVELCERFTYYGCQGTYQNYVTKSFHGNLGTGGLGMGNQAATGLVTFYQFWCYVTPLVGGLISDQYLGKYKTILYSAGVYMIGLLVLTCTSIPKSLSSGHALGGFIASILLTGIGTGGIKANVSPLIAEQYTRRHMEVALDKKGNRVVIDPYITVQHIYMMFYWSINIGALSLLATPCKLHEPCPLSLSLIDMTRYGADYRLLECVYLGSMHVCCGNDPARPRQEDLCRPPPEWHGCC
jgi:POT family proton-dependent oligopeptide transporter